MVRTHIRKGGHGAVTAGRLACQPATGRRRVVAPQQLPHRLQQKRKNF